MSDQRPVVVTGGARGIGRAVCGRFLAGGATVVALDVIDPEPCGHGTAGEREPVFLHCDVSSKQEVDRAFAEILGRFGPAGVLVCNAGVLRPEPFLDISEENWDVVLSVNLKSNFLCGQAAARQMIAGGSGGAIVNTASVGATLASELAASYSASKGGVVALTKAMAVGLAGDGIRVNAVAPGSVATAMMQPLMDNAQARRDIASRTPIQRFGLPEEIADAVVYLAGPGASYVTGHTLYVDGGRTALNYLLPVDEDRERP